MALLPQQRKQPLFHTTPKTITIPTNKHGMIIMYIISTYEYSICHYSYIIYISYIHIIPRTLLKALLHCRWPSATQNTATCMHQVTLSVEVLHTSRFPKVVNLNGCLKWSTSVDGRVMLHHTTCMKPCK